MKEDNNVVVSRGFYKKGISSCKRLAYLESCSDLEMPSDFDPDEISWVTPRLGVTDWEGGLSAYEAGDFVICVAEELQELGHVYMPIDPTRCQDQVIDTLDRVTKLISWIVSNTEKNVIVHSSMGMERGALVCAWFLRKYSAMTLDQAYSAIRTVRPIVVDRRSWIERPKSRVCIGEQSDGSELITKED